MFFFKNHDYLNNLSRGSPRKNFCSYNEIGSVVSNKKSFKVFYIDINGK